MRVFRWVVRIGSLLFLAFHVASFTGDSWPEAFSAWDKVSLVVWGIIVVGMIFAWQSEGAGGFVILAGFIIQVALRPDVLTMWAMWIAPTIGGLFVIYWAMSEGRFSR